MKQKGLLLFLLAAPLWAEDVTEPALPQPMTTEHKLEVAQLDRKLLQMEVEFRNLKARMDQIQQAFEALDKQKKALEEKLRGEYHAEGFTWGPDLEWVPLPAKPEKE